MAIAPDASPDAEHGSSSANSTSKDSGERFPAATLGSGSGDSGSRASAAELTARAMAKPLRRIRSIPPASAQREQRDHQLSIASLRRQWPMPLAPATAAEEEAAAAISRAAFAAPGRALRRSELRRGGDESGLVAAPTIRQAIANAAAATAAVAAEAAAGEAAAVQAAAAVACEAADAAGVESAAPRASPFAQSQAPSLSPATTPSPSPAAAAAAQSYPDAHPDLLELPNQPFVSPELFALNCQRFADGQPLTTDIFSDLFRSAYFDGGVFANADTPLGHIEAVGFDHDYTCASYNSNMGHYIYDAVAKHLVEQRSYPRELLDLAYDESFSIRGLLFDSQTGFIMKVDMYGKIQTDTVFYGRERVPVELVVRAYQGSVTIPRDVRARAVLFSDLFAAPEVCLLADAIQVFKDKGLVFEPRYIQQDVREAVGALHTSGRLHSVMAKDPERYFDPHPELGPVLGKLRESGKKLFLLTNSPYSFVDAGMRYLLRDYLQQTGLAAGDWRQLFDMVLCSARKPRFYSSTLPFRSLDLDTGVVGLNAVNEFRRGEVYVEGGLKDFMRLAKLDGRNVLYIGDHIHNDLAETQIAVWRTCAVVKELSREVRIMQSPAYQRLLRKLMAVEALASVGQTLQDAESRKLAERCRRQRDRIRHELRQHFNNNFGSVFRTNSNRSLFYFELSKHADVYTSSVGNFLHYPMNYTFYAVRSAFPHEGPLSWSSLFADQAPASHETESFIATAEDNIEEVVVAQEDTFDLLPSAHTLGSLPAQVAPAPALQPSVAAAMHRPRRE